MVKNTAVIVAARIITPFLALAEILATELLEMGILLLLISKHLELPLGRTSMTVLAADLSLFLYFLCFAPFIFRL